MSHRAGPPWRREFGRGPGHRRPPWWPDDESWPPQDGHPWPAMRRRFIRRLVAVLVLLLLFASLGPIALAWFIASALGIPPFLATALTLLLVVSLLYGVARLARGVRGFAVPLGDLIEAASRVEARDYSARVPEVAGGPGELRSLVRAFNAMAARLEIDEEQRRSLLADISHELRTPLAVLQGELEAMADGVHPADETHLAATLEETRVMSRLVDDLRTLAMAESGALALHREPTDLGVLAEEVAAAFAPLARASRVSMTVAVADEIPLLDVDPVRLREVLSNLVANALRYAPAGTGVAIGAQVGPAGRVTVYVDDAGPGIPPELLPHLFERFSRSADSRGSGLGLAIARQLVEAHGGSISAGSRPGGGTSVRFELPA